MVIRYFRLILALVLVMCTGEDAMRADADTRLRPAPAQSPTAERLPRFEDYPANATFGGPPAPVRIESARYGRLYRTRLRDGASRGPNFAGSFTVVVWGCGSSCQIVSVVDARTGRLSEQTLRTANGVQYRVDSRLIIADPIRPRDPPSSECASCGTPAAYVWTGARFEHVGRGPHPHLSRDRPW